MQWEEQGNVKKWPGVRYVYLCKRTQDDKTWHVYMRQLLEIKLVPMNFDEWTANPFSRTSCQYHFRDVHYLEVQEIWSDDEVVNEWWPKHGYYRPEGYHNFLLDHGP